jgi:hypothetical protein
MNARIQLLKKVTISLKAGREPEKFDLTASPITLEFIYGVASDGLCPFESALNDKKVGDKLVLSVPTADAHEFFGHIFQYLHHVFGVHILPGSISFAIEITAVSDADNREVVQALAKALAHGSCGGSCGCGCG